MSCDGLQSDLAYRISSPCAVTSFKLLRLIIVCPNSKITLQLSMISQETQEHQNPKLCVSARWPQGNQGKLLSLLILPIQ